MPSLAFVNLTDYAFSFRSSITISSKCAVFHSCEDIGVLASYFDFSVCFECDRTVLNENTSPTSYVLSWIRSMHLVYPDGKKTHIDTTIRQE